MRLVNRLLNKIRALSLLFIFCLSAFICQGQITYEDAFPNLSFDHPTEIRNSGDGTDRIFVVEQPGSIKVFPNSPSTSNVATFIDIPSVYYHSPGREVGLLGLAFHPNYENNGYFYVYNTERPNGTIQMVLARYSVSSSNPNQADPNSRLEIFSFDKTSTSSTALNHNGGKIAFGPDGFLYISIGDGGGSEDANTNGQNLSNPFGSILRIDVDIDGSNPISSNGNYEIPDDNPRVGLSGMDELYAWGIRNTWKFSFDGTTLWGADVGGGNYEEINTIEKGGNYGWNRFEGDELINPDSDLVTSPDIKPIFFYGRENGDVSITGGYVYRGSSTDASLQGKYIFGDYVTGRVWSLNYSGTGSATSSLLFRTNGQYISSFGLDENGELYFSDYISSAKIYKITGGSSGPQNISINGVGSWSNLYSGVNGVVETLAVSNDDTIYVGGEFSVVGNIATNNIATYNIDTGWNSLGNGTNGIVNTISIAPNGDVYVGGFFSQINGVSASNIAMWNGSTWLPLGSGTSSPVSKINIDANNNVYVGGSFQNAGGITVNNIALWSNNTWSALTDNVTGISGTSNEVREIKIDYNNVYIGGNFDSAGGNSASSIAVWNNSTNRWSALGAGTSGFVEAIEITPTTVYAGGNFSNAGGQTVNRIAQWNKNSQEWSSLDFGLSGNVTDLEHDGTYLYVSGNFETASDVVNENKIVNYITRWSDAEGWGALGTNTSVGFNNIANAMVFSNDNSKLYTGGNFNTAGLVNANNIAVWGLNLGCVNNITPEYSVNGSISSGETEITVTEGDELILSIVESGVSFNIQFDGNTSNGDLNIGAVNSADAGIYTYSTSQGCTSTLTLTVNPIVNNDDDNDGVLNEEDNCPNTPTGQTVDANGCSQSQLDDDNDGVFNNLDNCPDTPSGETVDANGCSQSQLDDDNDGVFNNLDNCPNTPSGESVDVNGCSQSQLDDDNDGVFNNLDNCPNTPSGESVDVNGCSQSQLDDDNDGVFNNLDNCPDTPSGEPVDANGCAQSQLDDDNDTIFNNVDQCPNTPTDEVPNETGCSESQLDDDNDGVTNDIDQCPNTSPGGTVDAYGCLASEPDGDNDGVANAVDQCPNTPVGETANANGCSQSQLDDDDDNVRNGIDQCPNTPLGESVNIYGCSQSQLDDDNDGVFNNLDNCPDTPSGESVDANGCSQSQLDDDNDSVFNNLDNCPNTPSGESVDVNGCSQSQLDDDNDGVFNNLDNCPNTPSGDSVDANGCSQSQLDDDNDGVFNNLDNCPNTLAGTEVDVNGCPYDLPNTNFGIITTSTSCINASDGKITINAQESYTYSAVITGINYNNTYNFSSSLTINNLLSGTYDICITAIEFPGNEDCFKAVIGSPDELEVISEINQTNKILTLKLSGGNNYSIKINQKVFNTNKSEFSTILKDNVNEIKVTSDHECQGTYEEIIILTTNVIVHPNPFRDKININVGVSDSKTAKVSVFSSSGRLIKSDNYSLTNNTIILDDISLLATGTYYLVIRIDNMETTHKIIKL